MVGCHSKYDKKILRITIGTSMEKSLIDADLNYISKLFKTSNNSKIACSRIDFLARRIYLAKPLI